MTEPSVWPGAWRTVSSTPASDSTAPSSSGRTSDGSGSRTPVISGASAGPCQRAGSDSMPKSLGCR